MWRRAVRSPPASTSLHPQRCLRSGPHFPGFKTGCLIWGQWIVGNCKKKTHLHFLWRKGSWITSPGFLEVFLWVGIDFFQVSLLPTVAQVAENCLKDAFQSYSFPNPGQPWCPSASASCR